MEYRPRAGPPVAGQAFSCSGTHHRRPQDVLSPEFREVLVLKDMEGRKYEEMADLLEVPIGTIRSRLHRARLELRDILLQEEKKIEH